MADTYRLPTPTLRLYLRDSEPLEVQALNIDLYIWDMERAKRKWPLPSDAPWVWQTFLAWRAALRLELVPAGTGYDVFREDLLLAAEPVAADDGGEDDAGADPTRTAPAAS